MIKRAGEGGSPALRKAFPSCCLNGVGRLSNEGGPLANEGGTADL